MHVKETWKLEGAFYIRVASKLHDFASSTPWEGGMTPQDAREEEQSQRIRIDWGEWTIARTAAAAAAAAIPSLLKRLREGERGRMEDIRPE